MSFNEKIRCIGRQIGPEAIAESRRRELARWIEILEDSNITFVLDSRKASSTEAYVMCEGITSFFHTLCMDMVNGMQFHNAHILRTRSESDYWIHQIEEMVETALNREDWFWARMWTRLVATCKDIIVRYENDIGLDEEDRVQD